MFLKDGNLYYVGGVVRDEYLKTPNFDIDYCYEGNAIEFAQKNELNIVKANQAFGTVRIINGDKEIDIASTRIESYPRKGHLPVIDKIGCCLKDDMSRRDFTINAMAKRTTDEEIIDYYKGIDDIKNKTLRVLHKNSFVDDPTRIIRGLKFSIRFGFELSEETKELQNEYLSNINYDISYHRLRKELLEAFSLNKAEVFDKFVENRMYKLLGENVKAPKISSERIYNILRDIKSEHIWLLYLAPFLPDNTLIPLTRAEKRILKNAEKLKHSPISNNTPQESILLRDIIDTAD